MSQSTSAKRPTQPESLRLFFGLTCPAWATIRQQLQQLRDASQDPCSGLQVVSEASLHITLKFLGSCQAALTSPLIEVLETVGSDSDSFTLKLQGVGSFHGALWLGVDAQPGLTGLVQRLEQALLPLGFTVDS
ncbi:MAG: RNA 2',3'-cyclic phosphodiesterase, partial [Gammaproteobacteria bacterium]